ncbi:MAG TPA: hypothetical protein VGT08_18125 [Terracidiphilus sp.]|nr:hypothetical protein [Terracidiphilus sp.]
MKVKFSPLLLATACGLFLFAQVLVAQTDCTNLTCVQVFGAVDTRTSPTTANYAAPYTFNSATLNLTCNTSPIIATLSGPYMNGSGALQPGGNLLVDNNLLVSVNGGTATNVCAGGIYQGTSFEGQTVPPNLAQNCFTNGYAVASGWPTIPGPLNGQNPDTYLVSNGQTVDAIGGVPPLDISSLLVSGKQSVTIDPTDDGGILTSSSIFLATNCTQGGVSGGMISGNTFNSGDSTTLAQTFNFDRGNGQQVGFVYDVSAVNNPGNGAIPQTADAPLDPATFQPSYVPLTSFATSKCLIHTGELLSDGVTQACKLYTLECTDPTSGTTAGANCPASTVENEVVKDVFDGPPFSLQNIHTPYGTFHEGIGFLMAAEDWSAAKGGPCVFDPYSGLTASLPCPQNLLTSFTGPGGFSSTGLTTNPNSTFISVYGVPEDRTSVNVEGQKQGYWVNTLTPDVFFVSTPPNFSGGANIMVNGQLTALPGYLSYIPAPIKNISYGVTTLNNLPSPSNEPILNDTVLQSGACSPGPFTAVTEPSFAPPEQTLTIPGGEGQYLLHYYAQDCAGTQELLFTQDPSGSWSTYFYSIPINVDLTNPIAVITSPIPLQSFTKGTTVYGSFYCTDALNGAGVTHCGSNSYATGSTYDTRTVGPLSIKLNTSSVGPQTLSIDAVDGAGNKSTTSVNYTVTK